MTLPVLVAALALSALPALPALPARPAAPAFVLQISLAAPPPCAGSAVKPVGTIPIAKDAASGELHLALCDGRSVDLRAEIEASGDLFGVMAAAPDASSSTFLAPGQSFETVMQGVRLRFTLACAVACA